MAATGNGHQKKREEGNAILVGNLGKETEREGGRVQRAVLQQASPGAALEGEGMLTATVRMSPSQNSSCKVAVYLWDRLTDILDFKGQGDVYTFQGLNLPLQNSFKLAHHTLLR